MHEGLFIAMMSYWLAVGRN